MSTQFDPLKTTAPELHRFWFMISTEKQWYSIIGECRAWFGKNWRGMSKVRRKLHNPSGVRLHAVGLLPVWFEVPDERFASWCAVKFSLQVMSDAKFLGIKK